MIEGALDRIGAAHEDRAARLAETLGRAGFEISKFAPTRSPEAGRSASAIAEALVQQPGYSAARRADQPSRSCRDQVAGNAAAERAVCLRGGQPRPLLPGKRRERNGGAEPRLLRRLSARERQLQRVPRTKEQYPPRAAKHQEALENRVQNGDRMAAPRAQGAHHEIEIAHR